jgi:hypothetical protein
MQNGMAEGFEGVFGMNASVIGRLRRRCTSASCAMSGGVITITCGRNRNWARRCLPRSPSRYIWRISPEMSTKRRSIIISEPVSIQRSVRVAAQAASIHEVTILVGKVFSKDFGSTAFLHRSYNYH